MRRSISSRLGSDAGCSASGRKALVPSTATGVGWSGITPLVADVTGDGKADYIFIANNGAAGVVVYVAASTGSSFSAPVVWWHDSGTGWSGITPLVGDVNGDKQDDYVFLANSGSGTNAYVATSSGSTFAVPQLWWQSSWGYGGIKANLGDMDGNGGADLVLTTNQPEGGSAMSVLLSTYGSFLAPTQWWHDTGVGWTGITPFVADFNNYQINGHLASDYLFLANNNNVGTNAYVAMNTNGTASGLQGPALWWQSSWGYSGIKGSAN